MFSSIGIMEIILIAVVTILIVKPEDFPGFLRKIGHYYGKFHSTMFKFKNYTRDTFDQITNIDVDDPSHEDPYHSDYDDSYDNYSPAHTVSMDDNYDDEDEESGYDLYFSDDDYCEGYDEEMEFDDDDYGDFEDEWEEAAAEDESISAEETDDDSLYIDSEQENNESADEEKVETEAAAG